jgi:hypothetical protein
MPLILPILDVPDFSFRSPEVVRVLDRIRFKLDEDDRYSEFSWFAREYPRVYRHHLDHAKHRLLLIHEGYTNAQASFREQIGIGDKNAFEFAYCNARIMQIHWDFEAYLGSIGSALDTLARIIGVGYSQQLPLSFSRLCASKIDGDLVVVLRAAKARWVDRLKDYRDCFVHYTPSNTLLMIYCSRYSNGWETRLKLPVNPNVRDILLFVALDRNIAATISNLYKKGKFPVRIKNLFFTGTRSR